ncbi:MAG: hypothetical protein A4E66_00480 [Syntrophus sp. PtaB.Bin001]|nr:MAG: hypothetical protein A4E66_00480 [Syntrophus sp. PtaB.Bin001]
MRINGNPKLEEKDFACDVESLFIQVFLRTTESALPARDMQAMFRILKFTRWQYDYKTKCRQMVLRRMREAGM